MYAGEKQGPRHATCTNHIPKCERKTFAFFNMKPKQVKKCYERSSNGTLSFKVITKHEFYKWSNEVFRRCCQKDMPKNRFAVCLKHFDHDDIVPETLRENGVCTMPIFYGCIPRKSGTQKDEEILLHTEARKRGVRLTQRRRSTLRSSDAEESDNRNTRSKGPPPIPTKDVVLGHDHAAAAKPRPKRTRSGVVPSQDEASFEKEAVSCDPGNILTYEVLKSFTPLELNQLIGCKSLEFADALYDLIDFNGDFKRDQYKYYTGGRLTAESFTDGALLDAAACESRVQFHSEDQDSQEYDQLYKKFKPTVLAAPFTPASTCSKKRKTHHRGSSGDGAQLRRGPQHKLDAKTQFLLFKSICFPVTNNCTLMSRFIIEADFITTALFDS